MIKGSMLVSPKFFISFILIIIIICIVLIIVQPGNTIGNKDKAPELPSNYFNRPASWSSTEGKNLTVKNSAGQSIPLPGTSVCSLYTYENEFDVEIKPSLTNVFQDYYDGLVHRSDAKNVVCLDPNQVLAYNGVHTCDSKTPNSCINAYGNYVNYGVSEEYTINCRKNIPACPGAIYSISCNFQLSFLDSLDISSKFIAIDRIEVNDKDYDKFANEKNYYIDQGYFTKNKGLSVGVYKPLFFNDLYKNSSARQQFKIIRYNYDSDNKSWSISEIGPFATIIFQPANAYLTADENLDFILKTLDDIDYLDDPSDIIQWLMLPSMDLNPNTFPQDNKFIKGNIKNLTSESTIYGKNSDVDNGTTTFGLSVVFPPFNKVQVNDVVIPLNNNLSFSYNGDNIPSDTVAQKLEYPGTAFKAIQGGEASEQADFFEIDISATLTLRSSFEGPAPLDLSKVTSTPLNPTTTHYKEDRTRNADVITINANLNSTQIGDLSKGNLVFDNEVVWESFDPRDILTVFEPNYFTTSRDNNIAKEIVLNNKGSLAYKKEKTGLVDKINTDKITYDFNVFSPGSYQVLLNDNNCTGLNIDENANTNARIGLIFESSQDTNGNPITALADIIVLNNGTSYTDKTVFGIKSSSIPGTSQGASDIDNLEIITRDQEIIYNAISLSTDSGPQPFNPNTDRPDQYKNGALIIPEKDVSLNDNGDFSLAASSINLVLDNGGEGYNVNDTIYINQSDQFGNSLFGSSFNSNSIDQANMLKLASITIKSIQSAPIGISFAAKTSLLRTNPPSSHIALTTDDITYNFFKTSPGEYEPSPPQIGYVGDGLINELKEMIKEGSASEIASFFSSVKKGGNNFFTGIDFIKTIQFTDLNYIGYTPGSDSDVSDIKNNNSLGIDVQPILGRFIPYSKFRPPVYNSGDQFPTGTGTTVFYNNNYTQLVPYGLKNIYNNFIEGQNLASV